MSADDVVPLVERPEPVDEAALLTALVAEGFDVPAMPRVRDYPDPDDLRRADALAEAQNLDALSRALRNAGALR